MLENCLIHHNYESKFILTPGIGHRCGQQGTGVETTKKSHTAFEDELKKSSPIRISDTVERDIYGKNAFLRAADNDDETEFHRLLKQCIGRDDLNFEDYSQRNALILAAMSGKESIVEQLLETNAMRVDSQDMAEFTALMYAAQRGHQSIVEKLLGIGADYALCNINGDTAIILAARRNQVGCLQLLARFAKSAIDWTVEGDCGLTAEQWAETNGYEEAALFIRETVAAMNRGVPDRPVKSG